MAIVAEANKLVDPLEPFPVFRKFNKNGLSVELFVNRSTDIENEVKQWAFELTKKNMQLKYEQCSWGWNDKTKEEELFDEAAWYLVAKNVEDGKLLGFSHFRFDMDEGLEVLYCYELQLDSLIQRKGLGKFMMQILELVAFKNNMKKVILTVLKNNQYSNFFKNIGYVVDETSPEDDPEEDEYYPYEILSKVNKRLMPPTNTKPSHDVHCCSGHSHHH
ncbi:unnamed protein product [Acanthoscelides obtectus]|uniref:N-alpha-acetyltransferase 40 n=1 Tax=Acanthoscelides obtectus TaxID=200917 RepID=A0A9P0JNV3_ACAOB|nr:unnamed protein product [Acanthoscelides obtectus]CAK1673591.1 N-alpha-acetyltransferase 40 [Acanthoscelides obtectus]